jgi:hypothetical protein
MAMARFMSAFLVFMITVVALYVITITFGSAMDQMAYMFPGIQANMTLPANWDGIATKTLTYWGLMWRSITVIIISLGLWVVRTALVDVDYSRPQ